MELDGLYEEYAKMIYHFIFLKCGNRELAEDIVQTTFLKAVTQIDSFQGECKISTWLCQIANHEYLNYCRKHNRQSSYEEYIEKNGEVSLTKGSGAHDVMLDQLILHEQTDIIKAALQKLQEPYKQVLMMRIYGEYSFGEIGKVFHKDDTWARVTYYRAKKKLIEEMRKKEGYYEV